MDTVYYRKCSVCGRGMNSGYVIDDETYCSIECRSKVMSEAVYDTAYSDDSDFAYYTEWEEPDGTGEPTYNAKGEEINE